MAQEPVILNIYDMYWVNGYLANMGIGIYHSGVEVYGSEYAYGGHPLPCSGIFKTEPRDAEELGENFKYRESVLLGTTDFTHDEIEKLILHSGEEFRGDKYHLMNKNCNHFTSFIAKILCGKDIPKWVNRLAFISTCVPFLERMLPKEWLTPIALQQSLNQQRRLSSSMSLPLPPMNKIAALPPERFSQLFNDTDSVATYQAVQISPLSDVDTQVSDQLHLEDAKETLWEPSTGSSFSAANEIDDLVSACEIIDFRSTPQRAVIQQLPPGIAYADEMKEATTSTNHSPVHRLNFKNGKMDFQAPAAKKNLSSTVAYEHQTISSTVHIVSPLPKKEAKNLSSDVESAKTKEKK